MEAEIRIEDASDVPMAAVISLYEANNWSAAKKPVELCKALANSDSLFLAWHGERLAGLGNAISDGYLVVYFHTCSSTPNINGVVLAR